MNAGNMLDYLFTRKLFSLKVCLSTGPNKQKVDVVQIIVDATPKHRKAIPRHSPISGK
jgi:hypothetical protein